MKKNIFKGLLLGLIVATSFSACREDKFVNPDNDLGDGGKTIIRIADGPQRTLFLTAFSDIRPVDLFDIRRDVNSNAALMAGGTVQLVAAPDLITAYNTANPAAPLTQLPESIFTMAGTGITKSGTGYAVTFAPGQMAKNFTINLNGGQFDLSKKYAVAFTIAAPTDGSAVTATTQKQILAIVSIKNKYDGVYSVVNTSWSYSLNAAFTPGTPRVRHLITKSADEATLYDPGLAAGYGIYFLNAGTGTYFGNFSPIFKFDLATDKVIGVSNYYPVPNSSNRDARLDPSGVNQMVITANGRTMDVTYNMVTSGAVVLVNRETWTYTGSR